MKDFHSTEPNPDAYLFYSRNKGVMSKMTPEGVNQQFKKYAALAHRICSDVPINLHVHQPTCKGFTLVRRWNEYRTNLIFTWTCKIGDNNELSGHYDRTGV